MTTGELKARYDLMNQVVFPALANRTRTYADKVCQDFLKRHKIIKDDFPQGSLVMKQVIPRSSKAEPGWEGPYTVMRRTRGGTYILRDQTGEVSAKGTPVSQLRLISYENNISPDSFEVEKLVGHRTTNGKREYLIKWKGFSEESNTWTPEADVDTMQCIVEYWDNVRRTSPLVAPPSRRPRGRDLEPLAPLDRRSHADSADRPPSKRARRT
jgi:hypothetical protein